MLTVDEVRRVVDAVEEPSRLIVKLLYGCGPRLLKAPTIRVEDLDFARGQDIRTVQELLGRREVSTTMISTHVVRHGARGVRSPLDPA